MILGILRRLWILIWKNCLIMIRNPLYTIWGVLGPAIIVMAYFRWIKGMPDEPMTNGYSAYPFKINDLGLPRRNLPRFRTINAFGYSPNTTFFRNFFNEIGRKLDLKPVGFAREKETEYLIKNYQLRQVVLATVNFPDDAELIELGSEINTNHKLKYKLRFPQLLRSNIDFWYDNEKFWETHMLYSIELPGPYSPLKFKFGIQRSGYEVEGFLQMQQAIAITIAEMGNHPEAIQTLLDLSIRKFPIAPHGRLPAKEIGTLFSFSFLIILAYNYYYTFIVNYVVREKESHVKESIKLMGLSSILHWIAWFIIFLILSTISTLLYSLQLKYGINLFENTSFFVIWLFFVIYQISSIFYGFFISTFFPKSSIAVPLTIIFVVANFALKNITDITTLTTFQKVIFHLFSHAALDYGIKIFFIFETSGEGVNFNNIWQSPSETNNSIGDVMIWMLVASVFYFVLTLYVEKLFPGNFGVGEHWSFPLRIFKQDFDYTVLENAAAYEQEVNLNRIDHHFEQDDLNLPVGIDIRDLTKEYENHIVMNKMRLKIYEHQVTVLLGHNGAGKSTLVLMLVGMVAPTKGTVIINGYDIRTHIHKVRRTMGLCTQHNILYDDLTVIEHIRFIATLRGMNSHAINNEIEKFLKMLKMESVKNKCSRDLSASVKRKLSTIIAICGNPLVVFLDEPSAGMDMRDKNLLWKLIEQERIGRTIILTTNDMLEADTLGDRICILKNGCLVSVGSPIFIKYTFGTGYILSLVKGDNFNRNETHQVLKEIEIGIQILKDDDYQIQYTVAYTEKKNFGKLFEELEKRQTELGIKKIGISLASLNEAIQYATAEVTEDHKQFVLDFPPRLTWTTTFSIERLFGFKLFLSRLMALVLKKIYYTKNNYFMIFVYLGIPYLITRISISGRVNQQPSLYVSKLDNYRETKTPINLQTESNTLLEEIGNNYQNIILESGQYHLPVLLDESVDEYFLKLSDQMKARPSTIHLVAVTITANLKMLWYNEKAIHTAPLTLSLYHNAVLKCIFGKNFRLDVINEPILHNFERGENIKFYLNGHLKLSLYLPLGFLYLNAYYVLFYIDERKCKLKLIQMISGINIWFYWIISFLCDLTTSFLSMLVIYCVMLIFKDQCMVGFYPFCHLALFFMCSSFGLLSLIYVLSFLFKTGSIGFVNTYLLFQSIGMFCARYFSDESRRNPFLLLIPPFNVVIVAENVFKYLIGIKLDEIAKGEFRPLEKYFYMTPEKYLWTSIYFYYLYLIISGCLLIVILVLIEYNPLRTWKQLIRHTRRLRRNTSQIVPESDSKTDINVLTEEKKVKLMTEDNMVLTNIVARNLYKRFGKTNVIDGVSFRVPGGECFGVAGLSGAGKTTLFEILLGDISSTSGDAYFRGTNIFTNGRILQPYFGYCPQIDTLLDDLSVFEHLKIFCLLYGISQDLINDVIDFFSYEMGISTELNKRAWTLSLGNKRRVNMTLALIGLPTILYMDETTLGLDPAGLKKMWSNYKHLCDLGRTIIMTSQRIEDYEHMAHRIAILKRGKFAALGSENELMERYGRGCMISFQIIRNINSEVPREEQFKILDSEVKLFFPTITLLMHYPNIRIYYLPGTKLLNRWSVIFYRLEAIKSRLRRLISDYDISLLSLEQICLSLMSEEDLSE